MKEKTLILINDYLEKYEELFNRIQEICPFDLKLSSLASFLSDEYKNSLTDKSASSLIIGASDILFRKNEGKIEKFLKDIYKPPFQNFLFIYSKHDFNETKELGSNENNVFILSEKDHIQSQALNFNLYVSELFNEITITSRLSGYIMDSAQSLVMSQLMKKQKEKIEQLNKELDEKNTSLLKELEMAQRVQLAIMPSLEALSIRKELKLAHNYTPLESVGGDLYDMIRVGRNGYGFLIADVSGHGVPAALITALAKSSFNFHSGWGVTPSEICNRVNNEIYEIIGDLGYYLTAYYGIINLETGEFQFTNAGHHAAILYRLQTKEIEKLDSRGTFIGIFENPKYETKSMRLCEGDRILFITDGIVEARNIHREIYSYNRIIDFVEKNSTLPPTDFVDKLIDDVDNFSEGEPAEDDKTVFYVEFVSKMKDQDTLESVLNIASKSKKADKKN